MIRAKVTAFCILALLVSIAITSPRPTLAQFNRQRRIRPAAEVSAAEVRRAIQDGIRSLELNQAEDGSWPDAGKVRNGCTALCTLALLNAADRHDRPSILKGIEAIRAERQKRTYFIALRIMVLATADPTGKKYRSEVQADVDWLVKTQSKDGGWFYGSSDQPLPTSDSSNTQFALLALHEANRMGATIKDDVWKKVKSYWKQREIAGGGYGYSHSSGAFLRNRRGRTPSLTMAVAGLASSIIIEENLPDLNSLLDGAAMNCCGENELDPHQELTASLIGNNFQTRTPGGQNGRWVYYFIYGLERAGRLSGKRFFGPYDWYREGASRLINWQVQGGSWTGKNSGIAKDETSDVATSMALLFLSKGKRPIAIGKYLFDTADDSLHSKGVHYLTRNLEEAWEQKLNWQEVKGPTATANDLLETPVLFMSGNGSFVLSDFQKENLKKYLENGGFLFAEACNGDGCRDAGFDQSFRNLMRELFPDNALEKLPPSHPVWTSHFRLDQTSKRPPMFGLQACCRTAVMYSPVNLACFWNADRLGVERQMRKEMGKFKQLLGEIKYATKVGVNVATYATGRDLKEKGDRPNVDDIVSVREERTHLFPKLIHGGGHDEAPNAWRNIQKKLVETGISINLKKEFVKADFELGVHPFIFMHGREAFEFTDEERSAIKVYLTEMNGFIFADSICSSKEFTSSFKIEMKKILGTPLKTIPSSHKIWNDQRFLFKIDRVTLKTKIDDTGKFDETIGPPKLFGHEINDRLAVVFSSHDLSCAMESAAASQCDGYTRKDAERIGLNVLLYRLGVE